MENPAVKLKNETAGKKTERLKKWMTKTCVGLTASMLCVFSLAAGTEALSPPQRVTRTITRTEKVLQKTSYIDLPNVYRGYTEKVSGGTPGEQELQMQVIMEGDTIVRVLGIKAVETAKPVDAVVKRGTKTLRSQTADGSRWKVSFARPVKTGWLSADFYDYKGHNGIDLAAPYGTPVYAAASGRVVLSGWYGEYGRCVIIEHEDGSRTLYGHNSALTVSAGQTVKQGQQIAKIGSTGNSTGNHLHFEIRVGDRFLDPLIYMDQ